MPAPASSEASAVWQPLRHLWAVDPVLEVPSVRWWIRGDRLVWEMKMPKPLAARETFKTGGFTAHLWKRDVAEFFIVDRRTGLYTEYNLSPGGAWWSAHFSAPRVPLEQQPAPENFGVKTEITWAGNHWTGRLSLPLPDLAQCSVNFNAVTLGPKPGGGDYQYFSLAPLTASKPDFHRPTEWLPVTMRP